MSDTFVFKTNFQLFYAKMLSCTLIFPKVPPDPLPPPYLVRIQDSEFTETFDLIPYLIKICCFQIRCYPQ